MTFVDLLKQKELTISFAESMTGGALASHLTMIPGASHVFKGSLVCYDTEIKINILNVTKTLIDTYGVVSKEVSQDMAIKCQDLFKSSVAVSVTGYADGEHKDIFVTIRDHETNVFHLIRQDQNRRDMIQEVVAFVFNEVQKRITHRT